MVMIVAPIVVAVGTYILRRFVWIQLILSCTTMLFLSLLVQKAPMDQMVVVFGRDMYFGSSWAILGRAFVMVNHDMPLLTFLFISVLIFFVCGALVSVGFMFYPILLGLVAIIMAIIFVQPFVYAALFIQLMAVLCVFIMTDKIYDNIKASLRYLSFVSIGVPFILMAGWQLEMFQVTPDDTDLLVNASWMLGVGIFVLLGVVPFHTWMPILSRRSSPIVASFVISIVQLAILFFLVDILVEFEWMRNNLQFFSALLLSGIVMVLIGGIFILNQENIGNIMGYSALIDWGCTLVAIGLRLPESIGIATMIISTRVLSLIVWGVGVSSVFNNDNNKTIHNMQNYMKSKPYSTIAIFVAGMSLGAMPLFAGFPARWALVNLLSDNYMTYSIIIVVASVFIWLCYLNLLAKMHLRYDFLNKNFYKLTRENKGVVVFSFCSFVVIVGLGIAPQFLYNRVVLIFDTLSLLLN